jgi:hypothetical protein
MRLAREIMTIALCRILRLRSKKHAAPLRTLDLIVSQVNPTHDVII